MRKERIDQDGPSPLARLKRLVRENPAEGEFLEAQSQQLSASRLIAQIESRHGIAGLTEPRLSDFWRWLSEQRALRQMNEDAESFREAFHQDNPAATLEEAHEATLAWLHLRAARGDDEKLMKFVLGEMRKARSLAHTREQWREEMKTKLDAGMEALFKEIKENPAALRLFDQLKETLAK